MERVAMTNKARSFVIALLVTTAILVVAVPIAGYVWLTVEGHEAADRTTTFLEAWQARDYELVQDLLAQECFQTAGELRATLGDSEITDINVDRRTYSFGTVTRGSISFDDANVKNFEFNFEGDRLCGPVLWDPQS